MIERGENLTLVPKTIEYGRRVVSPAHHLDGHFFFVLAVGTACPIYLPHASAADFFEDAVRANPASGTAGSAVWPGASQVQRARIQKSGSRVVVSEQQRFHFVAKIRVLGANRVEV